MEQEKVENKNQVIYNKAMPWWKHEIYGTELLGMRLLRKKSIYALKSAAERGGSYE